MGNEQGALTEFAAGVQTFGFLKTVQCFQRGLNADADKFV